MPPPPGPPPPPPSDFSYVVFFILVLVVHLMDVFTRMSGQSFGVRPQDWFIYFCYIVLIPFWAAYGPLRNLPERNKVIVVCTLLSVFLPFLNYLARPLASVSPLLTMILAGMMIWSPVWLLYLMYMGGGRWTQAIGGLYLLFWVLLIVFSNWQFINQQAGLIRVGGIIPGVPGLQVPGIQPGFTIADLFTKAVAGVTSFSGTAWKTAQKTIFGITDSIDQTIQLAAYGDLYTGKVEQQTKKELGVFLGGVQALQNSYAVGRPVGVFTTLRAETIEKPINISLRCSCCSGDSTDAIVCSAVDKGSCVISPKSEFTVTSHEQRQIDCKFPAGTLAKAGVQTITMTAQFTFPTLAYVRTYFMDSDRIQSLRAQGIDPLYNYGIRETDPQAVYTSGPVNIGMGVSESPQPLAIDVTDAQKDLTLSMTIANTWNGRIVRVTSLDLIVPEGFEITDVNSFDYDFKECAPETLGNGLSCPLPLSIFDVPKDNTARVVQLIPVRVHLRIPSSQYARVLGKDPLAVKFFKANFDYVYELTESTAVRMT